MSPFDVEAHLSLLSDLDRPESRDALARLVASAEGLDVWEVHALLEGEADYEWTWPASEWPEEARTMPPREALPIIALHVLGSQL